MSDEASLIVDCAAAPDDDRPRLVYADFLQQRGDPRGELIAVQCALELARTADDDVLAGARSVLPRAMKFRTR